MFVVDYVVLNVPVVAVDIVTVVDLIVVIVVDVGFACVFLF